jgi:hypothetical protein
LVEGPLPTTLSCGGPREADGRRNALSLPDRFLNSRNKGRRHAKAAQTKLK